MEVLALQYRERVSISSTFYIQIFCTNVSFFYVLVTREKLPKQNLYEKFVNKMLMKLTKGEPYLPPIDDLAENLYYYGSENPLLYNDSYELIFHCQFELKNYPFDNQQCFILVKT